MAEIKYQHAFIDNDRDNIVSIDDITNDNRKQFKFYCIGCGQELMPRAIGSKYRRPHFYHREIVECSGETYLHKLTKLIIKQKFYKEPTFMIEYEVTKECNNTECKYKNPRCREGDPSYPIDLKKYYDTCTEEAPINGYIADILLTNSKNPHIEPILIEVCVSHPCDEDKRNSGLRIIEIKIRKELDLINFKKNNVLRESSRYALKREKIVEFISFKRDIKITNQVKLQRYVYNPNLDPIGYLTEIDCSMAKYKLRTNSAVELNVVNIKNYGECGLWEVFLWMSKHKGLRRCLLCKFYYATMYEEYSTCRLSKKHGKPAYPSMDEAERCRSYYPKDIPVNIQKPEDIFIEEVVTPPYFEKPEYKVILAVSRSFKDYDLFKEKFLFYLSEKMNTHTLVVITGASRLTDLFTDKLLKDVNFIKEPHDADWGKYGQDAIRVSNDEMTTYADALIAFWDGQSLGIKNMIDLAKQKNIKVAVVKY